MSKPLSLGSSPGSKSQPQIAAAHYPDGEAYYRYLVRYSTTMDVTPEELEAALRRVAVQVQEVIHELEGEASRPPDVREAENRQGATAGANGGRANRSRPGRGALGRRP